ncbi:hypothetical protein PC123_g4588 [Phytophthora cactorum]|nr:hypothetical protein PC120_g1862 [Phytophthora cactorum]KAG4060527.1 hypothetical protein PC123_g4588 [Phytophthora cactorum]
MPAANGSSNFLGRQHRSKHSADLTALKPTSVRTTNTNKAQYYRQPLGPTAAPASSAPPGRSPAVRTSTSNQRSASMQSQPIQEPSRGRSHSPAGHLERAQ